MRTFRLVLEYDGARYMGWQFQPAQPTVQSVLEDAIARVLGPHRTNVAGRTDTGVSALGQVATLRTGKDVKADALHRALNGILPPDIAVVTLDEVPNEFDPRRDAERKLYRYRCFHRRVRPVFERDQVCHVWNVDWDRVEIAAQHLVGTHDFASFQGAGADRGSKTPGEPGAPASKGKRAKRVRQTVRTLYRVEVMRTPPRPNEVWIEVEGNGFLKQMVRNLCGSLLYVGRGFREPAWILEVLAARDRAVAGPTAPASGLTLVRVEYREPAP